MKPATGAAQIKTKMPVDIPDPPFPVGGGNARLNVGGVVRSLKNVVLLYGDFSSGFVSCDLLLEELGCSDVGFDV